MNPTTYEGAFAELPPPGYHVISRLEPAGAAPLSIDVIKLPVLERRGRELVCEYENLTDDIHDELAVALIIDVILGEFTDHYYRDQVDTISFINQQTLTRRTMPYPR
ncbi:hypothetical protein [Chondromyces crocatus]|uniref:Uncharacterized protein n=1 Tax=Chondromyces crocatus TaxID=52 RepID=A0A0K1ED82_CHOCO|nr:hypothetical protein [Chondromyces crocatus]AKT38533.1 uncharacterized protein CMC5_026800 [Chondromyces crocatus]